ncbi:MAG: hypothetical protein J6Y37_07460 [Paludibacteraceae bacterium]|nr:hypothetical protein [Paludibacteraceae bacterium]
MGENLESSKEMQIFQTATEKLSRVSLEKLSSIEGFYLNDFHRQNSMAAMKEVRRMSLHPYTREQKLQQILEFKNHSITKKNANEERRRRQ